MDNKQTAQFPENLNFRVEDKEVYDYGAALRAIRWHWRLSNKSEAGRFAIRTMADIAWSAGAPRLTEEASGPARMGDSHNADSSS